MDDLTGFQRDLLWLVAGFDDVYGLTIADEIEAYYEQEISHGQLYPNLDTLVEKGLVEKGQNDCRTHTYTLTDHGQQTIEARAEWEAQCLDD